MRKKRLYVKCCGLSLGFSRRGTHAPRSGIILPWTKLTKEFWSYVEKLSEISPAS